MSLYVRTISHEGSLLHEEKLMHESRIQQIKSKKQKGKFINKQKIGYWPKVRFRSDSKTKSYEK